MNYPPGFAIAIDGPVGVGKSTVARKLAQMLQLTYIDSGAMYRAVALYNMRAGVSSADEAAIVASLPHIDIRLTPDGAIYLNDENVSADIRNQALAEYTSTIAVYGDVRAALTTQQKVLAAATPVVMDGRDIGSQVLPHAPVKIYLDAKPEIRAERRYRELISKGQKANRAQVLAETHTRDERDKNREHAPLVQAEGAKYVDASHMNAEETVAHIATLVQNYLKSQL
ncbi:MAG: (d)CMP kinase [Defluviitaleaceae bacterium]|nr:(d)CMP kinase [Defluviitaleaceae bacterium]